MDFAEKDRARFMAKVYPEPNSGCWLWDGLIGSHGYGIVSQRPTKLAHRVSHEMHIGQIPDGMYVCHRCDVRACVSPSHLFAGTQLENMADMRSKGRAAVGERNGHRLHPGIAKGARNGFAKLNDERVRHIRELAGAGVRQREIARREGVSDATVSMIVTRKYWSHIS